MNIKLMRYGIQPFQMMLFGPRKSGKTSLIYRWKLNLFVNAQPTYGILKESFVSDLFFWDYQPGSTEDCCLNTKHKIKFKVHEIGANLKDLEQSSFVENNIIYKTLDYMIDFTFGQPTAIYLKIRNIMTQCKAFLYIIDSSSRDQLAQMCSDIQFLLKEVDLIKNRSLFMIIVNKQDLPQSIDLDLIKQMLDIEPKLKKNVIILGSSALVGSGCNEILINCIKLAQI